MRWLVLGLLIGNLAYFAWGMLHESHAEYELKEAHNQLPVLEGQRLQLVSEREEKAGESFKRQMSINKAKANVDVAEQCLLLGPFVSERAADKLQQWLFSVGVNSRERADKDPHGSDYWVHIPPLPSRGAAIRLLRELQEQKIDSFVITQGELTNGISLGLFSRQQSAENVRRRLIDAGYSVSIKSLPRNPEKWWLEITASEEAALDPTFWEKAAGSYPELKKLKKNCKTVASSTEFH